MTSNPTFEELQSRIQSELDHFDGDLPERIALVWYGYFAALLEWGLITPSEHQALATMLPTISDNPVMAVFLGRPDK